MGRALALPGALLAGLVLAMVVSSCGGPRHRATVRTPRMAAVGDGVWAVTDYDDPVFYSGDYYWRYSDDAWYRSQYLGGWNRVGVSVVPPRVRGIDRPRRYRRWTPRRQVQVRPVPRQHVRRADETRVRRPPASRQRGVRREAPRTRDARIETRQDRRIERRQDRRIERRDDRRGRRIERRQAGPDRREARRDARRPRR